MEFKKPCRPTALSGGMAFSLCVLVFVVLSLVASAVMLALSGTEAAKYISYLVSPVAILITLIVMYYYCGVPKKTLFPVRTSPKYILLGVCLIFGLMFSLGSLNDLFISLLEKFGYVRQQSSLPDMTGWKIVPVLFVVAVLPAVFEELLFRALILNNISGEAGETRAVLLVGMCFSLYHGSVEQTIYQFICGCMFALLAVRSGSVLPSVIIHFLNNALIIVLSAVGAFDEAGALNISYAANIAVTVLSAVSLVASSAVLIFCGRKQQKYEKGAIKQFFMGASVGIAVMAVLWIASVF